MGGLEDVVGVLNDVVAHLPGGDVRVGQAQMAEAVARAIEGRSHLLVQAGTGTGKSLAYLVPAVLAGERVVVVTATKALQEQLCRKDLPFLQGAMARSGRDFSFAQLKGRANYVCRARLAEHARNRDGVLEGIRADDALLDEIDNWVVDTTTGDRAELKSPVGDSLWATLSMDSRECPGRIACAYGDDCFAELARFAAAASDIVVVNTALYAADVASGGAVLPPHAVVVIDEAHMLEDVCADAFGAAIGQRRIERLAAEINTLLASETGGKDDDVVALAERARAWGELIRSCPPDERIDLDVSGLRPALMVLNEDLAKLHAEVGKVDPVDVDSTLKRLRLHSLIDSARNDIQYMMAATADRDAIWVERREPPILVVSSIDVGPRLSSGIFAKATAILTSATLAVGDDFGLIAWRLGLRDDLLTQERIASDFSETESESTDSKRPAEPTKFESLDVGSPFDFRRQALLYCATHLPDPRVEAFSEAWLSEAVGLVRSAGGRTLGLCTSLRAAGELRDALRAALPDLRVLSPEDLPRARLMKEFASDETSCLIGSLGLWQGLDIPGPSLSLVLVDKIPFARPNDPLSMARRERAELEGRDPFRTIDLPRAALLLAQGAGRLVRSHEDRGVVAILDKRFAKGSYSRALIDSLPPMYKSTDGARVRAALERLAVARNDLDSGS